MKHGYLITDWQFLAIVTTLNCHLSSSTPFALSFSLSLPPSLSLLPIPYAATRPHWLFSFSPPLPTSIQRTPSLPPPPSRPLDLPPGCHSSLNTRVCVYVCHRLRGGSRLHPSPLGASVAGVTATRHRRVQLKLHPAWAPRPSRSVLRRSPGPWEALKP